MLLDEVFWWRCVGAFVTLYYGGGWLRRDRTQIEKNEPLSNHRWPGKQSVRYTFERLKRLANVDREFRLARTKNDHNAGAKRGSG